MTWQKYDFERANKVFEFSEGFYQKIIDGVHANIVKYDEKTYELHIQIPEDLSKTKKTININCFSYDALNFSLIESHAKILINSLKK